MGRLAFNTDARIVRESALILSFIHVLICESKHQVIFLSGIWIIIEKETRISLRKINKFGVHAAY